jgi:hypothetical protein
MFSGVPLLIRKVGSSNSGSPSASNTGEDNRPVEIILAGWVDRFVAWLIDFIIVSIGFRNYVCFVSNSIFGFPIIVTIWH